MNKTITGLITLLILFKPLSSETIDLSKAIEMALKNNHQLNVSRYTLESAREDVSEAYGYALPRLDLNASYGYNLIDPEFVIPVLDKYVGGFGEPLVDPVTQRTAFPSGTDYNIVTSIEMTQTLFDYTVLTGIGSSKIYEQAAAEGLNNETANTIFQTKVAFYTSLLSRESFELAKSNFANAEKRYSDIKLRFSEGMISEYDEIRANVQLENLRPELLNSENNFKNTLNNLKLVLGEDENAQFSPEGKLLDFIKDSKIPQEKDAADEVKSNNFSLKSMNHQIGVQDAFVELYKSEYFPRISAYVNYLNTSQTDELGFYGVENSLAGIRMSINLFSGLQTNAKVEKAKIAKLQAQEQMSLMETNLQNKASSLARQMKTSKSQINAAGKNVSQAERGYEIANLRYREGVGSLLEVNDSDLALRMAKLNRLQAVYSFLVASAQYDMLIGKIN
jgi:outer membrane protein